MENVKKRRKHLFYVLILIPVFFLLLERGIGIKFALKHVTFEELAEYAGGYSNVIILNILGIFINYCFYLYFLIPSSFLRTLKKTQFSKIMAWIVSALYFIILPFWHVLANMVLGLSRIGVPNPFVWLHTPAIISSYFILTFPELSDEARKTLIQKEDGTFEFHEQSPGTKKTEQKPFVTTVKDLTLTWNEKLINLWHGSRLLRLFCFISGCWIAIILTIAIMVDLYGEGPLSYSPFIAFIPVIFGGTMTYIYQRFVK